MKALDRLRARNPGRPIAGILFYGTMCDFLMLALMLVYRYRIYHRQRVPKSGVFIIISNHQSHFDPIVAGLAIRPRDVNFLARASLFKFKPFGMLIAALNSIPLKQGESDIVAIRAAIENLKAGRCMLMFPEGSRTLDGSMHPFKRGIWLLLSRAKCAVLPIAVEGGYDAFPRRKTYPNLFGHRLAADVGEPMSWATLEAMGPDRGLEYLSQTIETMRAALAERLIAEGAPITTRPASAVDQVEPGEAAPAPAPATARAH